MRETGASFVVRRYPGSQPRIELTGPGNGTFFQPENVSWSGRQRITARSLGWTDHSLIQTEELVPFRKTE